MRLLCIVAALASHAAFAEQLPDPTRPPAGFGSETPAAGEVADAVPRLQSVLLPKQGRPAAVIGGRLVYLGDRVGEARLVRLTEAEAVISGPLGTQRLRLTPEVEKQPASVTNDKKPSRKTKESP